MKSLENRNLVANHIEPVAEVLEDRGVDYRILGGIATGALLHAHRLDYQQREILVGPCHDQSVYRENGTIRDVDILLMSSDKDEQIETAEELRANPNVIFPVSVFGFSKLEELTERSVMRGQLDFTTHRAVDENGNFYYVAHPFVQQVSRESYHAWSTVFSNHLTVKTLSPIGTTSAYEVRSISGIRPKDYQKYELVKQRVRNLSELEDYLDLHDDYVEWSRFRDTMLMGSIGLNEDLLVYRAFRFRKRLLQYAEKHPLAVDIAQGKGLLGEKIEPILGRIIGAS